MWKHIFNTYAFTIYFFFFFLHSVWQHKRIYAGSMYIFFKQTRLSVFSLYTTGNRLAFHANHSRKRQDLKSCTAAMLPVKLCPAWAEKLSCHTKYRCPNPKKISFLIFWSFLMYLLPDAIFHYPLIWFKQDLYKLPPCINIVEPWFKTKDAPY